MAISTISNAVNPQAPPPLYCVLRSGDNPPCIFPYEGAQGDAFVADMIGCGWRAEMFDGVYVLLTAPENTNVIPFPRHPSVEIPAT